uniref:intramembrane prenyl-peptidase Rce1 n=1 Tax=Physcomitrium patens TaxID=3218 RepID=A0A7I4DJJ6_PHYPA
MISTRNDWQWACSVGAKAMAANPSFSSGTAILACAAMAVLYVGMLYTPSLLFRLPPARTINEHYIRRFTCSVVASVLASGLCFWLLGSPIDMLRNGDLPAALAVLGIRRDHVATLYPLLLTALLYLGPLVMTALNTDERLEDEAKVEMGFIQGLFTRTRDNVISLTTDIFAWRNYIVGPLTEEWVFRACMVPVLLCAGYSQLKVMLLCPLYFGLAHLNHYWETVYPENRNHKIAALITGFRFAYTTIFGWYAAFLYLRTGHLVAPLVAHIFCNVMGLPAVGDALESPYNKVIGLTFLVGLGSFICLLNPATSPALYGYMPGQCLPTAS